MTWIGSSCQNSAANYAEIFTQLNPSLHRITLDQESRSHLWLEQIVQHPGVISDSATQAWQTAQQLRQKTRKLRLAIENQQSALRSLGSSRRVKNYIFYPASGSAMPRADSMRKALDQYVNYLNHRFGKRLEQPLPKIGETLYASAFRTQAAADEPSNPAVQSSAYPPALAIADLNLILIKILAYEQKILGKIFPLPHPDENKPCFTVPSPQVLPQRDTLALDETYTFSIHLTGAGCWETLFPPRIYERGNPWYRSARPDIRIVSQEPGIKQILLHVHYHDLESGQDSVLLLKKKYVILAE
ncbi:MAG: hypothetical protein HC880_01950 [Bacteroidia bacterium]|nr:hypothetical protein [Bacteroidia bacterium]